MRSPSSCSSPLLLLLALVLLCPPQTSSAPLPTDQPPRPGSALHLLQALLDHGPDRRPQRDRDLDHGPDRRPHRDRDLDHGPNRRPQRDRDLDLRTDQSLDLLDALELFPSWVQSDLGQDLGPDLGSDSDEDLYLDWALARSEREDLQRDLEEGDRHSEALTAVAGGLQAVSRERGGIGFRFGRKRTTVANFGTSRD